MNTEQIIVANIKCSGCATTIKNELLKIDGIADAEVFNDQDMVTVTYTNSPNRKAVIDKLYALGYPEATKENGLLLQLKSYTSCMIGRVSNLTHKTI